MIEPGTTTEKTTHCPIQQAAETQLQLVLPADLVKRKCKVAVLINYPYLTVKNTWWRSKSIKRTYFLLETDGNSRRIGPRIQTLRYSPVLRGFPGLVAIPKPVEAGTAEGSTDGDNWKWYAAANQLLKIVLLFPDDKNNSSYHVVDAIEYGGRRHDNISATLVRELPTYSSKAGVDNIWEITLPPKMIENARARLKEFDERKKKAAKKTTGA